MRRSYRTSNRWVGWSILWSWVQTRICSRRRSLIYRLWRVWLPLKRYERILWGEFVPSRTVTLSVHVHLFRNNYQKSCVRTAKHRVGDQLADSGEDDHRYASNHHHAEKHTWIKWNRSSAGIGGTTWSRLDLDWVGRGGGAGWWPLQCVGRGEFW